MLKTIAIVLAVGVVVVLAYAATRPDTFSVARTATVQAPPEKLHGLEARNLADLKQRAERT